MALLNDIAAKLVSASVGTLGSSASTSATLFIGRMPNSPDACVVLYEYSGFEPAQTFGTNPAAIRKPRVQIVCRGSRGDYATPRSKAESALSAIAGLSNQTVNGTNYLNISLVSSPVHIDIDNQDRFLIATNYEVWF